MSQENVDQVREAVDAFNRRDLDAYLALMEPDVELTPYERAVEGLGPYRGHGGVRTWWQESPAALPYVHREFVQPGSQPAKLPSCHGLRRLDGRACGS